MLGADQKLIPGEVRLVTSVEGIDEYRLANGLRVLLFPDAGTDSVTVNITYLVGSRQEVYGQSGLAHLLEHMQFKGTAAIPDAARLLQQRGARYNATTSYDRTNYFETLTASEENLRFALELEADRMRNSRLDVSEFESEAGVVRNEFKRGENNPIGVLRERILSTMFLWHNYGKSVIGAYSDLEQVKVESLRAFYDTWYQPDNAFLIVAGRFDELRALQLIDEIFGPIPKPQRMLPTFATLDPAQDGERSVTLRRNGDNAMVAIAYHTPDGAHADMAPLELFSLVMGDAPSGRLHKALVESHKVSEVWVGMMQLKDPGALMAMTFLQQGDSPEEAQRVLLEVIEGVSAQPITSEELERARATALRYRQQALLDTDRFCSGLSEWISRGDWRLFFLHRDRLRSATLADLQRVGETYMKASNRTLGVFLPAAAPERIEIPPPTDIVTALDGYKGDPAFQAGESFDATPANIEARTIRRRLSNGMRTAMLAKKRRGGAVSASLVLHLGNEVDLQGRTQAGEMVPEMLSRGTARHSREQLSMELDRLLARVSFSGNALSLNVEIETRRENLPGTLRLAAEMLRESVFPEPEFEQFRKETLASLEYRLTEPGSLAFNAWQRHSTPKPKEHPHYTPAYPEQIERAKAVRLEEVREFHHDFYGSADADFAISGDFDPDGITALLEEIFGGWRAAKSFERVRESFVMAPPLEETIAVADKPNAIWLTGINVPVGVNEEDFPALRLAAYLIGGGAMTSRLGTRIRVQDGLSYSVSADLDPSSFDPVSHFIAYAICAPADETRVRQAFEEEMARIPLVGFPDAELEEAKRGWIQSRQVRRSRDRELSALLAQRLYEGRTLDWDVALESRVQALTSDQVVAAIVRHLDPRKFSHFRVGDF